MTDSPAQPNIKTLIQSRLQPRLSLLNPYQPQVIRLLNGYTEGLPGWMVDLYAANLVISEHTSPGPSSRQTAEQITQTIHTQLPWLQGALHKQRRSTDEEERKGKWLMKNHETREITENGVRYAIDLRLNQDDSFYPDPRLLRAWLKDHMAGLSVLNTFAYTGSLGIAALAGGAREVIQTDLNPRFLALARRSFQLNHFTGSQHILPLDFFAAINRFKTADQLFDCVILDPPFFSTTEAGLVDLAGNWRGLINKVRPMVAHQGFLVLVNNGLYVSGQAVMAEVDYLCSSGYFSVETKIDVPPDCVGYPETIIGTPPVDSAPFNHPTKMIILRATRKDGRCATETVCFITFRRGKALSLPSVLNKRIFDNPVRASSLPLCPLHRSPMWGLEVDGYLCPLHRSPMWVLEVDGYRPFSVSCRASFSVSSRASFAKDLALHPSLCHPEPLLRLRSVPFRKGSGTSSFFVSSRASFATAKRPLAGRIWLLLLQNNHVTPKSQRPDPSCVGMTRSSATLALD
ncbi:MAG: class I SAM-dependent methyltransferase [Anaerolineaceae bacterium]